MGWVEGCVAVEWTHDRTRVHLGPTIAISKHSIEEERLVLERLPPIHTRPRFVTE
eukprot:COSAG06_NODE_58304_length_277_cov_0.876404_1_plen_54_part_10